MSDVRPAAVVVLAAGEGTRMCSTTPKVLHEIGGRTLLGHVLAALAPLDAARTVVVVGHARDLVTDSLPAQVLAVVQAEQRGTGHAVRLALGPLEGVTGTVLVVAGDTPLLTSTTLRDLLDRHADSGAAATVLTAVLDDATGYGRVLRDGTGTTGAVLGIVEHKDATDEQLAVGEINTGVFAFQADPLRKALARLSTDNAAGEEYLTDALALLRADGAAIAAHVTADATETVGVNDRVQLAAAARALNNRWLEIAMRGGVTVADPLTTWLDADVVLEPDVTLLPGTRLRGNTAVGTGATIGPDTTLTDTTVGPGARIESSTCIGATVGADARVGPYSFLRPGAVLGSGAKVGAFCEVKASTIGEGSKVPHLSYVGDTTIGARSNIGAATVTVNYDGVDKHRTVIGDDVRIGSDTMLVAPVTVHDGAYTAAGSVITEDVPAGSLGVGRARQRNILGWVARRRGGTPEPAPTQQPVTGNDQGEPSQ